MIAPGLSALLKGYSIEVMPKTAAKISSFKHLFPPETLIYIAQIEGTPINDMLATAKRLKNEGFRTMPHITARTIRDKNELNSILTQYRAEAGVDSALVLAGGAKEVYGTFDSSMSLLQTGLFDKHGFRQIHFAGHPEGNVDIDTRGGTTKVDKALVFKKDYAQHTDAKVALVTQFAFDGKAVINWANRISESGIDLPVFVGVAGPAKLQTLIKFSIACGVGPSLKVLKRRARDITKLIKPFEPTEVLLQLNEILTTQTNNQIKGVHFFPLGGIQATSNWLKENN